MYSVVLFGGALELLVCGLVRELSGLWSWWCESTPGSKSNLLEVRGQIYPSNFAKSSTV